jgi:hypothetical protein
MVSPQLLHVTDQPAASRNPDVTAWSLPFHFFSASLFYIEFLNGDGSFHSDDEIRLRCGTSLPRQFAAFKGVSYSGILPGCGLAG